MPPRQHSLIDRCATKWTPRKSGTRYPSDLTDMEWERIAPLIPSPRPNGFHHSKNMRAIVDGIIYVLTTRCTWSLIPSDLPARTTLNDYLVRWERDGTLQRLHAALYREGH